MKADIGFYLDRTVEERLPQLTTSESPLRLERKVTDFYILRSQDPVLAHSFVYGTTDSEMMSEDPLHIEAQKSLGFQSGSYLHYGGCNLNPEKIAVFKKIMEHIVANDIPLYMTAKDESGEEILVRGYNPITNTEIQNPNFKQTLPDLLE
nr:hypothetical protein [Candidatus Woesearchaeota archaeon]